MQLSLLCIHLHFLKLIYTSMCFVFLRNILVVGKRTLASRPLIENAKYVVLL